VSSQNTPYLARLDEPVRWVIGNDASVSRTCEYIRADAQLPVLAPTASNLKIASLVHYIELLEIAKG
jgi:hypothetical protein